MYQEVLHSTRYKRNDDGIIIIKIDLETVVGRLSRKFIIDTLEKVALPDNWTGPETLCVVLKLLICQFFGMAGNSMDFIHPGESDKAMLSARTFLSYAWIGLAISSTRRWPTQLEARQTLPVWTFSLLLSLTYFLLMIFYSL